MNGRFRTDVEAISEGEEATLAGMRIAGVVLHKAIVLNRLSGEELKDLAAETGGMQMNAFTEDLRDVRQVLLDFCEVLEEAERRAHAATIGEATNAQH